MEPHRENIYSMRTPDIKQKIKTPWNSMLLCGETKKHKQ